MSDRLANTTRVRNTITDMLAFALEMHYPGRSDDDHNSIMAIAFRADDRIAAANDRIAELDGDTTGLRAQLAASQERVAELGDALNKSERDLDKATRKGMELANLYGHALEKLATVTADRDRLRGLLDDVRTDMTRRGQGGACNGCGEFAHDGCTPHCLFTEIDAALTPRGEGGKVEPECPGRGGVCDWDGPPDAMRCLACGRLWGERMPTDEEYAQRAGLSAQERVLRGLPPTPTEGASE